MAKTCLDGCCRSGEMSNNKRSCENLKYNFLLFSQYDMSNSSSDTETDCKEPDGLTRLVAYEAFMYVSIPPKSHD